jgi:hypothetical protein
VISPAAQGIIHQDNKLPPRAWRLSPFVVAHIGDPGMGTGSPIRVPPKV